MWLFENANGDIFVWNDICSTYICSDHLNGNVKKILLLRCIFLPSIVIQKTGILVQKSSKLCQLLPFFIIAWKERNFKDS
jgi:hypothetical protein